MINSETKKIEVGLYCAGWVKRGPVGIIDATLRDSMDTFRIIKHHLDNEMLPSTSADITNFIKGTNIIDSDGWRRIRAKEFSEGEKLGKIKEKILEKDAMMGVGLK